MRKPTLKDFDNGDGTIDYDEFEEVFGDYEDTVYDESKDKEIDSDDQI